MPPQEHLRTCWSMVVIPEGPLTILKESWTGKNDTSANLAQTVADYLFDLRSRLSEAAEFVQSHTEAAQQGYAVHYNLRARQRKFQEGDQVIVFASENTGKMSNRWLGSGTVVNIKSPYSYLVDLGNACMLTKRVNSLLEFKVAVLLPSVTQNLVKCCHQKLLLIRVACRVLESSRSSSVIWTRVNAPSWSRCWTSSLPASRTSQGSATS